MKTAIVVLSDPKSGSEEALGRAFNALSSAYDFKQKGDDVTILFQGPATRWAGHLTKKDHPFHELYKAVADKVAGASCGCADAFGATSDVQAAGWSLVKDNPVPGTTGLPSLRNLVSAGYTVLTF